MDKKCKHHVPFDWNCNACSDSGDDPRKITEDENLELKINFAMSAIDAEDKDHAGIRGVVKRMILAGFDKHETCDALGYDD